MIDFFNVSSSCFIQIFFLFTIKLFFFSSSLALIGFFYLSRLGCGYFLLLERKIFTHTQYKKKKTS